MFLDTAAVMVTKMVKMEDDEAAGEVGEEGFGTRSLYKLIYYQK